MCDSTCTMILEEVQVINDYVRPYPYENTSHHKLLVFAQLSQFLVFWNAMGSSRPPAISAYLVSKVLQA